LGSSEIAGVAGHTGNLTLDLGHVPRRPVRNGPNSENRPVASLLTDITQETVVESPITPPRPPPPSNMPLTTVNPPGRSPPAPSLCYSLIKSSKATVRDASLFHAQLMALFQSDGATMPDHV
jgi:hypothetical protein